MSLRITIQITLFGICNFGALIISLIRACVANDILKWVGCVRRGGGGAVLGIVGGDVTFRF